MSEELDYVLIESGQAPTLENNLMPNLIHLTTDEANHVNEQFEAFNSTQLYVRLEEESSND